MPGADEPDAGLSWPRAVAIAAVALVVGIGLVVVTDVIVTKLGGLRRHAGVYRDNMLVVGRTNSERARRKWRSFVERGLPRSVSRRGSTT